MKILNIPPFAGKRSYCSAQMLVRQRGVVLFIALIALVAMSLAGIALMRSVDTGNLIAGNLAFKQSALHASDTGVELAFADLPTITSRDVDIANRYFATTQPVTAASKGIPTTINWSTVACRNANNTAGAATVALCADASLHRVQYVIDRQCLGPTPVTDIKNKCYNETPEEEGGGSKKANAETFSSAQQVYYRATIRVLGPGNAESFVQTYFLVPQI